MSRRVSVVRSQWSLLTIWSVFGVVAFVVVFIQTSPSGVYAGDAASVWEWFLPTLVPMLSLLMGTVVAQARMPQPRATVRASYYWLAASSSILYLAFVIVVLLMFAQSQNPVGDLRAAGKALSALSAVAGISLGTFFASKTTDP